MTLFGWPEWRASRGPKHPYYIVAPPYDSRSAGNRVLYSLADQLAMLGYPAFMVIHDDYEPIVGDDPEACQALYLTPEVANAHFAAGLTPVTVYPEISQSLSPAGLRVFYLLNYIGLLGGPDSIPECDYVLAYSRNIAKRSGHVDGIIYVPVSDPDYWYPDPEVERDIVTAYCGKYVDEYKMELPAETQGAVKITRHHPDAPTREQIRALLRRSRRLYVYENTAIATEAALCGCPVVYRPNRYFLELIAEHEHGLDGFTTSGDPEAVTRAAAGLPAFLRSYIRARQRLPAAVAAFARRTQKLARRRPYTCPFEVRPLRAGR